MLAQDCVDQCAAMVADRARTGGLGYRGDWWEGQSGGARCFCWREYTTDIFVLYVSVLFHFCFLFFFVKQNSPLSFSAQKVIPPVSVEEPFSVLQMHN